MKLRLLDLIACPVCKGELRLDTFEEERVPVPPDPPEEPACGRVCARHGVDVASGVAPARWGCGDCHATSIREGLLVCDDCGQEFPVVDGVPRLIREAAREYAGWFARRDPRIRAGLRGEGAAAEDARPALPDERSRRSFAHQWARFEYEDKTWFKDGELRRREFPEGFGVSPSDLRGALLLDAGCGNGHLTASIASYGMEVVGMDFSRSVERAHAMRERLAGSRAAFVHFLQGDVLEPPLRSGVFDYVHSSGVLHHTPAPEKGLARLVATAREGGRVYIQLYRRREAWVGIPNRLIRAVTSRLPVGVTWALCWMAVPLHTALVRLVAWLRGERAMLVGSTVRERAVSLFDNYSPRYQFRYEAEEVFELLRRQGLVDVRETTFANEARHMVAFVGRRPFEPGRAAGAVEPRSARVGGRG